MAEGVLFNVAERLLEVLGSPVFQEINLAVGVHQEIRELKETVETINAVLLDAEEQHSKKNHQVTVWLGRLKDAMYEADDLLDDFFTELQQREVVIGNKMAKAVRIFFSKSYQIAYSLKMGHKIKTIRERLDKIANDRRFHLNENHAETKLKRETHSFVREETIIGRDDDKNAIIQLLLDSNHVENVSVIPIVGIGGLGKSTLAQLVYKDEKVKNYFQLRMWVCVSNEFDFQIIVRKIIETVMTKEELQKFNGDQLQELCSKIDKNKYLLILDDVWNENPNKWLELKDLLKNSSKGSKILITTRSKQVAKITSKIPPYVLRGLDEDKSWSLFKQIAFYQGIEPEDSRLVEIGKEIVTKCKGVPLAIRAIASSLYDNYTEAKWLDLKDNELSEILAQEEDDIIPILKLSYDHLPSELKQCFAYCALFPKDYDIPRNKLINLWVAQGFIQQSNKNQCLEDAGIECFMNLLSRLFFQNIEYDELGNIITCKMHDLMHDLAQNVAKTECIMITSDAKDIDHKTRHLSFGYRLDSSWKVPPTLLRVKHIRTFLLSTFHVNGFNCNKILSSFRCLRMLDLSSSEIATVPNSIGKLKHLRYVDLSGNYINKLPSSLARLRNLETLDLSDCSELKELPNNIGKLVNLKHLIIDGCCSLTNMPRGLRLLTNLQTLPLYVVGKRNGWAYRKNSAVEGLNGLNNLRGKLKIENLGHMENTRLANLEAKEYLQSLRLVWDSNNRDANEEMLEGLKPHPNLKEFILKSFMGVRLSNWLSSIINLTTIKIDYCRRCKYIPPLDQLPCLESLLLLRLRHLEYILVKGSNDSSSTRSTTFFPSLKVLSLYCCRKLEGWRRKDDNHNDGVPIQITDLPSFHCLSTLSIEMCPNLISMPLYPSLGELTLSMTSSKPLQETMMLMTSVAVAPSTSSSFSTSFSQLKSLFISDIEDLESVPKDWLRNLTLLVKMTISKCPRLSQLSQGIRFLTSLQDMTIEFCEELDLLNDDDDMQWQGLRSLNSLKFHGLPKLVSLPKGLQYVTTLQDLTIANCPNLTALPEWICNLTSLVDLEISYCDNLTTLNEGIKSQCLVIDQCPQLSEKYGKNMAVNWPKIAHIPNIEVDGTRIQEEGHYRLNSGECSSTSTELEQLETDALPHNFSSSKQHGCNRHGE